MSSCHFMRTQTAEASFESINMAIAGQSLPSFRYISFLFSSVEEEGAKMGCAPSRQTPTMMDRVIVFHSTSQWRAHFKASKSSNKLMIIDFSASWCGPCRLMEPFIIELADKYSDVEFSKIDVDELPAVSRDFGVQDMPTFVLIKGGKEIDRVIGAEKDELQWKIEKHRAIY